MDLADRKLLPSFDRGNRQQAITFWRRNGAPEDQETGNTAIGIADPVPSKIIAITMKGITPAPKTFLSFRAK